MNKEEMKNKVLENIAIETSRLKAEIEALRSIRRLKKKDGSDFASIHRNFASSESCLYWRESGRGNTEELVVAYTYDTPERKSISGSNCITGYALEGTSLFNELKEKGLGVVDGGCNGITNYIVLDADTIQAIIIDKIARDEAKLENLKKEQGTMIESVYKMYDLVEAVIEERERLDNKTKYGYIVSDILRKAILYKL